MSHRHHLDDRPPLPGSGRVEDYTSAFLVSFGALLFVILFAIWAIAGLIFAMLTGYAIDRSIPRR